jgi:hypothetical protein
VQNFFWEGGGKQAYQCQELTPLMYKPNNRIRQSKVDLPATERPPQEEISTFSEIDLDEDIPIIISDRDGFSVAADMKFINSGLP